MYIYWFDRRLLWEITRQKKYQFPESREILSLWCSPPDGQQCLAHRWKADSRMEDYHRPKARGNCHTPTHYFCTYTHLFCPCRLALPFVTSLRGKVTVLLFGLTATTTANCLTVKFIL